MRVLALNGSARGKQGVTAKLLAALSGGLEAGGARLDTLVVQKLDVAPCISCFNCMHKTPGVCSQKDDMQEVYPLLQGADLLVLAAPVYTDGYPAQLKAIIDRCICCMESFLDRDPSGRVRHTFAWRMPAKFLLLSTCGFPEKITFEPLIANFRAQAGNFGSQAIGELCIPGSMALQVGWETLDAHLELLRQAGEEIARTGEISEVLAARINRPPLSTDEFMEAVKRYHAWARKSLDR